MRNAGPPAIFDFREELKRSKQRRWRKSLAVGFGGLAGGAVLGLAILSWPTVTATAAGLAGDRFAVCGIVRRTCVIDGDTFWLDGEKIRLADIDTPEISEPRCPSEYDRGIQARDRLVVLLNDGAFNLRPIGGRDADQYGRKLRVAMRDGRSIGDQLVGEGLARTWTGRREPWC